jgi:hypothetical protein
MPTLNIKQSDGTLKPIVGDAGGAGGGMMLLQDEIYYAGMYDLIVINFDGSAAPPSGFIFDRYVFEITQVANYSNVQGIIYATVNDSLDNDSYGWWSSQSGQLVGMTEFELIAPDGSSNTFDAVVRGEIGLLGSPSGYDAKMVYCNWTSTYVQDIGSGHQAPYVTQFAGVWVDRWASGNIGLYSLGLRSDGGYFNTDVCVRMWGVLSTAELPD